MRVSYAITTRRAGQRRNLSGAISGEPRHKAEYESVCDRIHTPDSLSLPWNHPLPERILVAVAWPYANGSLHLGHVAGCYLAADIFARYHRIKGSDVLMVSGSDTHGTPITIRADHEGITPQAVVDRYHASFLESWEKLGISFDLFTTTNTENHQNVTHDIFKVLHEKGYIYTDTTLLAIFQQPVANHEPR